MHVTTDVSDWAAIFQKSTEYGVKIDSPNGATLAFALYNGATQKLAIAGDGKITATNNLAFASGHGIDFSATFDGSNVSGVSSTSELLDYYEEGTFQPILKRLMTNNVTETNFYTQGTRQGNYTRIGHRVIITGSIHWDGGSTGSGSLIMTNLPFSVDNTNSGANEVPLVIGYRDGLNYTNVTGSVSYTQLTLPTTPYV